jgi:Fe-S-cluster-containing dehydrogenase component
MTLKRRDFLKGIAAGTGALLVSQAGPVIARGEKKEVPANALGILYDATLCIGCEACMVACKKANDMPFEYSGPDELWDNPRDLSSKTLNIIKKYTNGTGEVKNREVDGYSFIKRHCMHCADPACVSACPVSALIKDPKNGIVTYNKDACIGCRYCQVACPFNVPKFEWYSAFPKILKCQMCSHIVAKGGISACCKSCPTGASLFGLVKDLLGEAQRRLSFEPGKYYEFPVASFSSGEYQTHRAAHYVPSIYGENEIGGTQVLFLSGVPFSKLGLPMLPDESYASVADGIQYAIYKGMFYPLVVLGGLIYMIRKGNEGEK